MNNMKGLFAIVLLFLNTGITVTEAFGILGFGDSVKWREEVLLHDGRKIIADRSQSYGGRHETGQSTPIKEQDITFVVPGTNKKITWISEYSKDVGRANFALLALHILQNVPYIVTTPRLCLSYNKWGRPNPPYVIFKYNNNDWQRIPFEELPAEFITLNLTIETKSFEQELVSEKVVSSEKVKTLNGRLRQPEYKSILREALDVKQIACKEMLRVNDGWVGIEWFTSQPTYDRCLKICEIKKINQEQCPCDRLFNNNDKEK
jgi:hypothetical protein